MDKEKSIVVARKVFDAINEGKKVCAKGTLVDAVRVGSDGAICCFKFEDSEAKSGRYATIDATGAKIAVLSEIETIQTATPPATNP